MAGRARKVATVVTALESADALTAAVAASDKYLTVVDVHSSWAGPTTVVESLYRRIFVDLEKAEDRIRIHTVDVALMPEELKKHLPIAGCRPLFVVYKQKVVIAKIVGVNAPELEATILDNAPAIESDE